MQLVKIACDKNLDEGNVKGGTLKLNTNNRCLRPIMLRSPLVRLWEPCSRGAVVFLYEGRPAASSAKV